MYGQKRVFFKSHTETAQKNLHYGQKGCDIYEEFSDVSSVGCCDVVSEDSDSCEV